MQCTYAVLYSSSNVAVLMAVYLCSIEAMYSCLQCTHSGCSVDAVYSCSVFVQCIVQSMYLCSVFSALASCSACSVLCSVFVQCIYAVYCSILKQSIYAVSARVAMSGYLSRVVMQRISCSVFTVYLCSIDAGHPCQCTSVGVFMQCTYAVFTQYLCIIHAVDTT